MERKIQGNSRSVGTACNQLYSTSTTACARLLFYGGSDLASSKKDDKDPKSDLNISRSTRLYGFNGHQKCIDLQSCVGDLKKWYVKSRARKI